MPIAEWGVPEWSVAFAGVSVFSFFAFVLVDLWKDPPDGWWW